MLADQAEYRSCRRCRVKLTEPVSNQRSAFCCKGCHRNWYAQHCMACEGQRHKSRKCRLELASIRRHGMMGKFHQKRPFGAEIPDSAKPRAQTPIFIGSVGLSKRVEWRVVAGPALTERKLHLATLSPPKPAKWCVHNTASISPKDAPINIIGGYRFPGTEGFELWQEAA